MRDVSTAYGEPVEGEIDRRDQRAGDADRERVGALLQDAVTKGQLTIAEFSDRLGVAMSARTFGELDALVADLPAAAPRLRPAKDTIELHAGVGDLKRRGYWVVPRTVRVTAAMGDVLLDFSEAELTSPVVTVEIALGIGDATVVVPAGASVDADAVHASVGGVTDKTVKDRYDGRPHIVLVGAVRLGYVTIVHPRVWRIGPLRIHRPFRLSWGDPRRRRR